MQLPDLPLTSPMWVLALLGLVVVAAPPLARTLRLPGVVGLIIGGVLIGPGGLGLAARGGLIDSLGAAGLLYLIFTAGLELDLDGFARNRRSSVVFGAFSFLIPGLAAYWLAIRFGFSVSAALLFVAAWGSHTLLTYPTFRRFGATGSRPAALAVPATLVTDTAAMLVLAGVAAYAERGDLGLGFSLSIALRIAVVAVFTLVLLPGAARWIFLRTAQDRSERFLMLMTALFVAAVFAELAGLAAIFGAFLAGLGLNRLVPSGSALMVRVDAVGSGLFIPAFLVSVGMLIVPADVMRRPASVVWGLGFAVIAIGGKWLAAQAFGLLLRFDRYERLGLFSLTGSQAAATLATVVVGIDVAVMPEEAINGVVLVILAASTLAALAADHSAPYLPSPPDGKQPLGRVVLVPISNPDTGGALTRLAAALALQDSGLVLPITIVVDGANQAEGQKKLATRLEGIAASAGVEAHGVVRVDTSPEAGIIHAITEYDVTCLVMGWSGTPDGRYRATGAAVGEVLSRATLPTIIARMSTDQPVRVVMTIPSSRTAVIDASVSMAAIVARRVAKGWNLDLCMTGDLERAESLGLGGESPLRGKPKGTDIVVVPAPVSPRSLDRIASHARSRWRGASLLICIDTGDSR